jgi:ubiquinone/menaquinone biosynthesis C-methylase UbiE
MFLRRAPDSRDPLAVAMSGVRLGERVLQVGVDDGPLVGRIAAKTGLSGSASAVVSDEKAAGVARAGAHHAGVLLEVAIASYGALPHEDASFDVVVVHSTAGLLAGLTAPESGALLAECHRVLRPGGRIVTIEAGTRSGMSALLRPAPAAQQRYDRDGGATDSLTRAGFRPVRLLGDREGLTFSEGVKLG